MSKIDQNKHWYTLLHKAVTGQMYRPHTLGAGGPSWDSHGGAVDPGFMKKVDDPLEGQLGDCNKFLDAGCGIGTAMGYVPKEYKNTKIFRLELEDDRVNSAKKILTNAGLFTNRRVSIKKADLTDRRVWESILNENGDNKLCVWFNSVNFKERAVLSFQDITRDSIIVEGIMIV